LDEEEYGTTATSAGSSHSMRGDAEMMSVVNKNYRLGGRWDGRVDREATVWLWI